MNKSLQATICTLLLATTSEAVGFGGPAAIFGVKRGGAENISPSDQDEEYGRAKRAILKAVTTVEDHAQSVIAAEVENFFHSTKASAKQKDQVSERAEKAVKKATEKVKKSVNEHAETNVYPFEDHPYPYAYPQINNKNKPVQHKDHRILHSIEAAEKAVLHAIEDEVDTLFHHEHESDHKTTVQAGLSKTAQRVKDHHEDRRGWLSKQRDKGIDQYNSSMMFLEK